MDFYPIKFYIIIICAFYSGAFPASAYQFEFTIQPTDQTSLEGTNAILHCSAVSEPTQTIRYLWKRNGKYIDMINNKKFKTRLGGDLVITSLAQEDFGNDYQCVALCADGAIISRSAKLKKAQLSWHDLPSKVAINRKEGAYLLLKPPRLVSAPPAIFKWVLCNSQHQCAIPDPARSFMTSEGDLLISPILQSSENGKIPKVLISVKYFNEKNFTYGGITVTDKLKDGGWKSCPENAVIHLPTKSNFTVFEGQNVSLDCLAVIERCRSQLTINWRDKDMALRSTTRRLLLINVTKQDEGVYRCIPDNIASYTASYYVYVIEKPRVMKEPPRIVNLGYFGIVPGGAASNTDMIDWYRNAERIPPDSNSFQITANGSLLIRRWSSSFSGIYQIIFRNKAGTVSRTIRVDIPTGIDGDKITASSGEINFLQQDLPKGIAYYRWLIQTFSTAKLKLYFTDFFLNGPAQGAFVQLDRGLLYVHHFSDTSKPQGILEIAGPYIVISVYGNGTKLAKHGFRLLYGYEVTVPTTSVATATRSQSTPTKQRTTTATSTKQKSSTTTTTSTRQFTTPSGQPNRKSTLSSTTKNAGKPNSKTRKRTGTRPVDLITTATTSGTAKVTVSLPNKRINKKGSGATLFAGIGSSLAAIIVIAAGIVCYRRRKPKSDFKVPVSKEMALSGVGSAANNGSSRTDRSSSARETCFTVQGNQDQQSNMARYSDIMPDVIPSNEPNIYELGYIGPCNDPPTDENYTPLNVGAPSHYQETYTALQFDDVNKREHGPEVHPYAVVVPEEKNSHYMRADSTGSKDSKPTVPCPIYAEYERVGLGDHEIPRTDQETANARLYQQSPAEYQDPMPTVPIKRCVSESKLPRTAHTDQSDAASQPFYHVLDSNPVTDTKGGYSYCYAGLSKHEHDVQKEAISRPYQKSPNEYQAPMPTVPVKRCISDYGLSTAVHDILAEDASQPLYHVLECNSATDAKGSNSSCIDRLPSYEHDAQEDSSSQPFYHELENIVPNSSKTDTLDHKNVGNKSQTTELYLEPCPTQLASHKMPGQQIQERQQQRSEIKESPPEYHTAHYIEPNPINPSIVAIKQSPQMQIRGLHTKVSDGTVYMPSRNKNADHPIESDTNDLPLYQSLSNDGLYAPVKY